MSFFFGRGANPPAKTQTVNFSSTDTAAEIQALIDKIPKYIPTGIVITFQFANGTYASLAATINIDGFYGPGALRVYGDRTETDNSDLHTTQKVILDMSGDGVPAISISNCQCKVEVFNLRIKVDDGIRAIEFIDCPIDVRYWYSYSEVAGTSTNGYGVYFSNSRGVLRETYFTAGQYGAYCINNCYIFSLGNDDTGTMPITGMRALSNSVIGKDSTQITGSTSNETVSSGSAIR